MPQMPTLPLLFGMFLSSHVDRVVHVVALAALAFCQLALAVRRHFLPRAFGHVAAAHVLAHEDVAGLFEFARWPQRLGQPVHAIAQFAFGAHAGAVRGALHQERVAARAVLRHIDDREQLHAVTHRDPVLVLGIGFARRALAVLDAVRRQSRQTGLAKPAARHKPKTRAGSVRRIMAAFEEMNGDASVMGFPDQFQREMITPTAALPALHAHHAPARAPGGYDCADGTARRHRPAAPRYG